MKVSSVGLPMWTGFDSSCNYRAMARSSDGKLWHALVQSLRTELPGEWSVRGRGMNTALVREPVEWWLPWIGCSKASSIRLHAGYVSLLRESIERYVDLGGQQLGWSLEPGFPASFDPGDPDAEAELRTFAKHAIAMFDAKAARAPDVARLMMDELLHDRLEEADGRRGEHESAPALRVVVHQESPVPDARACIAWAERTYVDEPATLAAQRDYFSALIDAWERGGHAGGVAFLTSHRDTALKRLNLAA